MLVHKTKNPVITKANSCDDKSVLQTEVTGLTCHKINPFNFAICALLKVGRLLGDTMTVLGYFNDFLMTAYVTCNTKTSRCAYF